MELDSRKNEAKADLKQQDINIEVSVTQISNLIYHSGWPLHYRAF